MLVVDGLRNAAEMAYEVWWALVFGFAISAIVQAWVPRARIERALSGSGAAPALRATALAADTGHVHHTAASELPWRQRIRSASAWSDVAHNFRGDWQMLWKEIGIGFLLAGFAALIPTRVFNAAFVQDAPAPLRLIENVVLGPLIAVFSFVCSVGNIPLAAVLWSGGLSFGGVIAFVFADLIVLPIVAIYRKYYGGGFAARIVALVFVPMVASALVLDALFYDIHPDPARHIPPNAGLQPFA